MSLVFLDCETTGLDANKHQVWEIAYAVDDGPVQSSFVTHTLHGADPESLVIGRYMERYSHEVITGGYAEAFEADLIAALYGATLVGANPRFDAAFLAKRWGREPWHYRLLDVCAYVAGAQSMSRVPGLSEAAEIMGVLDEPNHTAAQDVLVTRKVYLAAKKLHGAQKEVLGF